MGCRTLILTEVDFDDLRDFANNAPQVVMT